MTRFDKYEWNALAKGSFGPVLIAAIMFLLAGTVAWPWSWIMNGLHFVLWSANG